MESRCWIDQVKESVTELHKLVEEGKDRNDAKVKEFEEKIRIALDVPEVIWISTGLTLRDVTENANKLLAAKQNSTLSSEKISDKHILKNASGGLALEGVYKTGNPEDLLERREQLIEIPDSFSLSDPTQSTRYEQREFLSHKSEIIFHKAMEKLGYSFSSSMNIGFKGFGSGFGVEKNESNETEDSSSNLQEESYILHAMYNYIPLACGFLKKDELRLSTEAINALEEIEKAILHSNDRKTQTNKVKSFYERFGSHVNQGPLHFGGVFCWRASASGFKSNDLSEIKQLTSASLDVYTRAGFGFNACSSGKAATSCEQLKGFLTGKHREDLMSQVQLSVSKVGGQSEIDNHILWWSYLTANNRSWSVIDRGTTLIPVWEILSSHRGNFKEVSNLSRILMEEYINITGEKTTIILNEKAERFMDLLKKLGLEELYPKKMTKANVLVIDGLSLKDVKKAQIEKELCSLYLYKLMTLDYRSKNLFVEPEARVDSENDGGNASNNDDSDDDDDLYESDDEPDMAESSKESHIHPMDMQMAIFHCSSDFLRQYIYTKLTTCQLSLPFLVPNPCTDEVEFPLWPLRHIRKSWHRKIGTVSGSSGKCLIRQMFNTPMPVVSFIRLGHSGLNSKSQILNGVINKGKHSVFFHHDSEGRTPENLLMNGLVEIAWYCPRGEDEDIYDECVAFLNLHGDAAEHPKQLDFLQAVSTVIVLLLSEDPLGESGKVVYRRLSKSPIPLICLFSGKKSMDQKTKSSKKVRKLAAKERSKAEFIAEIILNIKQCISGSSQTASMERFCEEARKQKFIVDEDKQLCQEGFAMAQTLMCILKENMGGNLSTIQPTVLPLQGKLWHDWCKKHKEQYRLQIKNEGIEMKLSEIQSEMEKIRQRQYYKANNPSNDFMSSFLECLTQFEDTHQYMLQWLRILLDDLTTNALECLDSDYNLTWSKIQNVPKGENKALYTDPLQKQMDSIMKEIADTTVGIEHIMREVSQHYEAIWTPGLPQLGVTMLLSGYPLELMDGDTAHVPITWISAVLYELIKTLGNKRVFVLSILGLQSSGKSTLLNTMFGLQFAVSAGRCTRGAFMQLLEVDASIRDELGYDFVLIVDTEGLRSPEHTNVTLNHDNELATFVIGIGDLTLINIMGENPSEMHDILQICVQAFLRMKQVRITPSCIFVHQNVAESSAGGKNIEARRRLLEKLDEMAEIAAKEENVANVTCFSDVIQFDIESQVFYFKNLLEGDPPMAPPNPSYSQNVQELKTKVLTAASWQEKHKFPLLSEFRQRVSDLWTALLQENFVFSFKNTVELMVYTSLEHKYSEWSWELRRHSLNLQTKLENQIGSNLIQTVTLADVTIEVNEVYNRLKTEIDAYFSEDNNKETLQFKSLKDELIEGIMKKCKDLLITKEKRSELDGRQARYTVQLTEQSKLLASKLKSRHLTEKNMEEEFEKLWVNWTNEVLRSQPTDAPLDVKPIVESILHKEFQSHPNIIEKIKRGRNELQFDPDKHINQNSVKKYWDKFCGKGNPVQAYTQALIEHARLEVNFYIRAKVNDKKDFDKNFIYEILSIIAKTIKEFENTQGSPKLSDEFKVDLSITLCLKNVSKFQKMHEEFKTANHPLTYLQNQREKYLQSFKNYCEGANSVKIFVDFLVDHITPSVLTAANDKTSHQVADIMKSNNPALNGNRSNLENHILKNLATQENFEMYKEYIDFPKMYFERFITEKVSEFCCDIRKLCTLYQENLQCLKSQILTATTTVTTEMEGNKGNAHQWLDSFYRKTGELMVINRDELRSIENEDIRDWQFLKDMMAKSLENMIKDKEIDVISLTEKATKTLCDQLQGCWAQCPFCKAICTNTIPNHDGDHSVRFHRSKVLAGWHYIGTGNFAIDFCTTSVVSDQCFVTHNEGKLIPYKTYRKAGDPYDKWNITGDGITQCYWKWFICKFRSEVENKYNRKFAGRGKIPEEWEKHSKESALAELQNPTN